MLRVVETFFLEVGRFFEMLWGVLVWTPRRPFDWRQWTQQMVRVGVNSLPVILLTAMFTGMVMPLQTTATLQRFGAERYVGSLVALSMVRELSAVLGGAQYNYFLHSLPHDVQC